ncbi:MAG: hypothetical protein ACFFCF_03115 [Promethearchaeota archaeon]
MAEEYGMITRITFIIHIIIGLIFGISFLVIPDIMLPLFGMAFVDPTVRMFGAIIIGFTVTSILGLMTREVVRVKIIIQAELIWLILGIIAGAVHLVIPPLLSLTFAGAAIGSLVILFILFLLSYFMEIR